MRVIPVLDVLGGRAVRARGGRRDDYGLIQSVLRPGSDPIDLALAVRDALGLRELYLADLDAILGGPPSPALYRGLAALGLETWIDAGLKDGSCVPTLADARVARIVVGLETVAGPEGLRRVIDAAGPIPIAFSLDLRDGRPILAAGADWGGSDPSRIVETVVESGISTVILLDLARVGMGRGVGTVGLLERLAADFPAVAWVVGGGISGASDLAILERAGASAALVGSAIHAGRITSRDLARWVDSSREQVDLGPRAD